MKRRPFEHLNILAAKEHKRRVSPKELFERFMTVGKAHYKDFTISEEQVKKIFREGVILSDFNRVYKDVTAKVLGVEPEEIVWQDRKEGRAPNRDRFEKLS